MKLSYLFLNVMVVVSLFLFFGGFVIQKGWWISIIGALLFFLILYLDGKFNHYEEEQEEYF